MCRLQYPVMKRSVESLKVFGFNTATLLIGMFLVKCMIGMRCGEPVCTTGSLNHRRLLCVAPSNLTTELWIGVVEARMEQ